MSPTVSNPSTSHVRGLASSQHAHRRIVYFYQYFTTPKGGWSTRAYEFSRRWVAAGDTVTVVTSLYDKSDLRTDRVLDLQTIDGIDVRIINVRLSNHHGFIWRLMTFVLYALLACWYALTLPADVVIASSGPITTALPGLAAHYLRRRRFIFEVRDLWPDIPIEVGVLRSRTLIMIARWCERLCYRAAESVVAVSEGMADVIRCRAPKANVIVVSNAADNELAEMIRPDCVLVPSDLKNKRLAIYAGTLGTANQCQQILDMSALLKKWGASDIAVILIGDGKERTALEREASRRGLDNVRFLGQLPRQEVLGWLYHASCALLVLRDTPLIGTGSPNKLFDALAMGTPVVLNVRGWMPDLVRRWNCGIGVAPNDIECLARAVLDVVGDPTTCDLLAHNARQLAKEQFDRNVLAARMRETFLSSR